MYMMRNAFRFFLFALFLVSVWSCGNKPQGTSSSGNVVEDSAEIVIGVKDSTMYGRAGDCGMSTFCLIRDDGDTLYVSRTSEKGEDGLIQGDLILDDRFCMIAGDHNSSLVLAINLTQLNQFVKNYKILNGKVVLPASNPEKCDTIQILELTSDSLVYKDMSGKRIIKK